MRWRKHSASDPRRAVQALLAPFEALLDSEHQGIRFHVVFQVRLGDVVSGADDAGGAARAVRIAARDAAADFLGQQSPVDLHTVRDLLARKMASVHTLVTPAVTFTSEVAVGLLPGDEEAVGRLLAAQREQSVVTARRRQEIQDVAQELAHPAAVMTRWIADGGGDWTRPPEKEAQTIAGLLASYRPPQPRAVEFALLEVVRDFMASFPETTQKQMVYGLLSAGMSRASRPDHAARVEEIARTAASGSEDAGPGGCP